MNENRNKYVSSPMYGMKKTPAQPPAGGGFQIRERPRNRNATLQTIMALLLPALFVVTLLLPHALVRWAFVALSALCLLVMWARRAFIRNARFTLSLVYGALIAVTVVSILTSAPAQDGSTGGSTPASASTSNGTGNAGYIFSTDTSAGALVDLSGGYDNTGVGSEPTAAPTPAVSAAQQRLELFFAYWAENNRTEMVSLCAPAWIAEQADPETSLFRVILNRTPLDYTIENISGSEADTSRTITLTSNIDKNDGKEPKLNRFQILMLRVNDVWYVDPNSLGAYETVVTSAPDGVSSAQAEVTATPAPSATATPPPTLLLYYNQDGGRYYHAVSDCSSVDEKYLPLSSFYYRDLNSDAYKSLLPCTRCTPVSR